MKNIFNIILTIIIINFSFYYTNLVSNYIKDKDPIMIKIKNNQDKYQIKPTNAIILNNTIIPGLNGLEINLNESYLKMKKINNYQESLLVFNDIKPDISLSNNQNKLIISGNQINNNVSILLKINDLNILKKVLNTKNLNGLNLILNTNFIKENYHILKDLKNDIIVNQNDKDIDNLDIIDYCYTENDLLNNCLDYNKFSIIPTFITNDYYYNTYQLINNGSILAYNVLNDKNIIEIKILLNGIKNLDYKIVSLDELLKE